MPSNLPVASVIGATGTQGFSVTKAFSEAGYSVRALTRSPAKAKAVFRDLVNVEPTYFDIASRASVESAFDGARVVFAMTFPDLRETLSPIGTYHKVEGAMDEEEQGRLLADVAKLKGVEVFLWSTVVADEQFVKNNPGIEGFRLRYNVSRYLEEIQLPSVNIAPGFFNENFVKYNTLHFNDRQELVYTLPHATLDSAYPHVSTGHDLGKVALLLVINFHSARLNHQTIRFAERVYTVREVLAVFTKVTGRPAILKSPDFFGVKDSPVDCLYKAMAKSSYLESSKVPDERLAAMGFRFQKLEDYVRDKIVPTL